MLSLRSYPAVFALTLAAPFAAPAHGQEAARPVSDTQEIELPGGVTEIASVEGITEYRLDNGLEVLLFPDETKQQTTVNITYFVGSRHEGYGETGMAHLLEHLVFKGTPNHPNIPQELTERGTFPNGTTWLDRTNYFETFPATEDNLEWAIDLEADRMVNSFIAKEDLDSEMTVVRNEWESGENRPFSVLGKRVRSAAFDWHNYGNSTIGARADIENVPIERLQAFYRKYYQPDNAVLVIGGKFDPQLALELVAEKFGAIPRPDRSGANQLFDTYTAEQPQDGERVVTLRRVGDEQIVMAAYHVPAGSHDDYAPLLVLSHVLSTRPAGRLYSALVEPGLAASIGASADRFREPGLLRTWARVREDGDLGAAATAMLEQLEAIGETAPPTEVEVERAKVDMLKNIELAFNNPQSIARQLTEWTALGDWRLFFLNRDRLEQVTPDAVRRVAATYLIPTNRTMGYFYPVDERPARADIPAAPDVEALVADYRGREAVAQGEEFDPSPMNIESRTRRIELPNGMELALTPKENRGDAVNASFTFRMGSEQALMGRAPEASLVGAMLRRGTTTRDRQAIEDEFDRLKAQVGFGSGSTSLGGSLQTTRENLADVVRLLEEVLREPSFPEAEFETLKQERLVALESQMSEPQAQASVAFQRHMNDWPEDHPLYTPTLDEMKSRLEGVTLEQVRAFYRDFYGAQDATFSIVGDFDPDELTAVVEEAFGDWEASSPFERIEDPYRDVPATDVDIETPDKANAMMIAAQPVRIRDSDEDYPALLLGSYVIGGGFLNSRLATRVRQEEGLSYGVGAQFAAPALDESGAFLGYAIFAPENADAVVAAVRDVFDEVLADGLTEEEIQAAKQGYLDTRQNARASDGTVASQLNGQLYLDRTYEFTAEQEASIRALTADQVNAALRRHIDPARFSVFRAGDFAGAEEAPTS